MKERKHLGVAIVVFVGVILLLGFNTFREHFGFDPKSAESGVPCINPALPIPPQYHIHPKLEIRINGENIPIPANIGINFLGCERVLHTHDTSGELHIEPNVYQEFTLKQFFALWEKPFSKERILEHAADADHEIMFTVDGERSDANEELILKDKQNIVIEYRFQR